MVVQRDDQLWAVPADRLCEVAAQRHAVFDHPVAVVEELDGVHPHLGGAGTLLGLPQRPGPIRRNPVDPCLATRDKQVGDLPALRGPHRYRAGRSVLEVVRMSRDR